ncbi:MAG TPA: hypothetical protein VIX42_08650 [Edaphobacter sp.]
MIQCEIINIHAGAENRPQFTFGFSALFVNPISSVSTGFFRFFSVLSEIRFILPQKPAKNALFSKSQAKRPKLVILTLSEAERKKPAFAFAVVSP